MKGGEAAEGVGGGAEEDWKGFHNQADAKWVIII
jgi:hypothetical protein